MPKLRNNKLSTLNNKNNISSGQNTDRNIKYFKRKLYNTRRPQQIRYDNNKDDVSLPDNYIGIVQTNFINCPDCNELIDIRIPLENQDKTISCSVCGKYDIDLEMELRRNNKIELLESAGFPSGTLINPPKQTISDILVRPTQIKQNYVTDGETGVKRRTYDETNTTMNTNRNRNKKIMNKDLLNEYNEMSDPDTKEFIKPVRTLIDKGLQITGLYDV